MLELNDKAKCNGCHACYSICPKNCISMKLDDEGFFYPTVDKEKCINCNLCGKICPSENNYNLEHQKLETYAAVNKSDTVRMKSSSGGVFTLLAEYIISQGGIVFGAMFDDDYKKVRHVSVERIEDVGKLRGSKYMQSEIGDCLLEAKKNLDFGRKVFFTGTPCQIAGLRAYLRKDYDNLFTQDLICHGCPSPKIWDCYVKYHEKIVGSKINGMQFRCKDTGWKNYSIVHNYNNGERYIENFKNDSFMQAFLSNLSLRPSCYNCHFKSENRLSNITLADFWGIQNVVPDMDDDKGVSAVLIHNSKGKLLFDSVINQIEVKEINVDEIKKYNPSLVQSAKCPSNRDKFFKSINNQNFEKAVNKYCKASFTSRMKEKFRKMKNKIDRRY